MNTEFLIDIGGFKAKIYMQIGFFNHKDLSYPLHKHIFAEMHVCLSGNVVMKCDAKDIRMQEGDVLFIPAEILHKYQEYNSDSKRISFMIDCGELSKKVNMISLPQSLLPLICKEIQEYTLSGKEGKLKALLSYICSDFLETDTKSGIAPITSRALIIEDFFSQKYNSGATLKDLSKELMLSPKQTEREVKRITGNSFAKELSKRKLSAAVILSQTTNLTLAEISELVGYTSYCGFYKAYRKALNCSPREHK